MTHSGERESLPRFAELEGEYEILKELGRGGTAVVYLAHERMLNRPVAIKVIRSTYIEDPEAIARLMREARTVGRMQHPNIVVLYGTRRLGDGSLALIMQYVPGQTLRTEIQRSGSLSFDRVYHILTDVCRALAYAHRQLIVHRDIKPENIYVDDDSGIARLADFGIARSWDSDSNLTLAGTAIGTPAYMSPEQIDGEDVDGRSDLYSLGLVGYEMLTGSRPWAGESLYSVIAKQKNVQLPSLSERRPGIPAALESAIERALRKDRNERWQSANEFLVALGSAPEAERVDEPRAPFQLLALESPLESAASPDLATTPPSSPRDNETVIWRPRAESEPAPPPAAEPAPSAAARSSPPRGAEPPTDPAFEVPAAEPAPPEGFESSPLPAPRLRPPRPAPASEPLPPAPPEPPEPEPLPLLEPEEPAEVAAAATESLRPPARPRPPVQSATRRRRRAVIVAAGIAVVVTMATAAVSLTLGGGSQPQPSAATEPPDAIVPAPTVPESRAPEPAPPGAAEIPENVLAPAASVDSEGSTTAAHAALVYAVFGDGQQGAAGAVLPKPLMVRVVDAAGRAVEGATVRFAVTAGDGSVQPTMGITNRDGVAATRWLPRTVGIHRAQARVDGLGGAPLAFRARALPGSAVSTRNSGARAGRREPVRTRVTTNQDPLPFTNRSVRTTAATAAPSSAAAWMPIQRELAAGGRHSCTLNRSGIAVCWGASDAGQLGGRPPAGGAPTVRVAAEEPFVAIAAGITHTCAVAMTGKALCWGANGAGQLGDGTRVNRSVPERVRLTDRLVSVSVGLQHSCALDSTGLISCWGQNNRGQLGDRTTADRSLAVRVAGRGTYRSVAAGWTHTCAVATDGAAYCWGSNRFGELGDGSAVDRASPVAVAGGHRFTSIAAGHRFTCGLRTDGAVLCWGENTHGQLGNGTTAHSATPVEILAADGFADVAAGGAHACAISWDGAAYCWGQNSYGQLGDGTVQGRLTPSAVTGGRRFTAITASIAHTCATGTGGGSFCWGSNREGQLGDAPRTVHTRPVAANAGT